MVVLSGVNTFPDRPRQPSNLSVSDVTANGAKLTWEEPDDEGGCPITSFLVEKRDAKRKMWQTVCEAYDDTEIQVS